MYSILIDNKYYRDKLLTPEEIVTYCLVQPLTISPIGKPAIIIPEEVLYGVYDNAFSSRKLKEKIVSCIRSLNSKGAISAIEVKNHIFIIEKVTNTRGENFSMVNYDHIVNILNSSYKNKDNLVYFYVWLMGTCRHKIGNFPAKFFAEHMGYNVNSIYSYFETLEELKVIYIKRNKKVSIRDGKYNGKPNSYCSYEDRNILIFNHDSFEPNQKRELKQKYNELKKGKEYPIATVYQIYTYVCEHNEKQELAHEINPEMIVDLWDETVFDNYLSNLP